MFCHFDLPPYLVVPYLWIQENPGAVKWSHKRRRKSPQFVSKGKMANAGWDSLLAESLQIADRYCVIVINRSILKWPGLHTETQPVKTDCGSWLYGWNLILSRWIWDMVYVNARVKWWWFLRDVRVLFSLSPHLPSSVAQPTKFILDFCSFSWQWYFQACKEDLRESGIAVISS